MRKITCALRADQSGVALTEFALSFPILLLTLAGIVDVSGLIVKQQRVALISEYAAHAAATAPEFTGRVRTAITKSIQKSFPPSEAQNISLYVSSLQNVNGKTQEVFEKKFGTGTGAAPVIPADYLKDIGVYNNEGMIFVEMKFKYRPLFSGYIIGDVDINKTVSMQPITSSVVEYSEKNDWGSEYVY